jgi:hypothetical protein
LFAALESGYSGLRREQGDFCPLKRGTNWQGIQGRILLFSPFSAHTITRQSLYRENIYICKTLKSKHINKLLKI